MRDVLKNSFHFALKLLGCRVKPAASTREGSPAFYFITFREKLSSEFFSPSIKDGGLQVYDYFFFRLLPPSQLLRPRPLQPRLSEFLAPGASFGHSRKKEKGKTGRDGIAED